MSKQVRGLCKLAGALGLALVLWLGAVTPVVWGGRQYQTLPTMPPPTQTTYSTPQTTSTRTSLPTTTSLPPTQTADRAASETAQAAATQTAVNMLPPTQTAKAVPPTVPAGGGGGTSAGGVTGTLVPVATGQGTAPQASTPTATQAVGGVNGGIIILIGAALLAGVMVLGFWLSGREKDANKPTR